VKRQASGSQLSQIVPAACGTVWNVVRSLKLNGAGRNIALYWDDVMNIEVGVEFDGPFESQDEVVKSATPAGRVAIATHYGPYPQLAQAHEGLRDYCKTQGHTLAGPSWEIYGHWQEAWNHHPSQIVTEVVYLLN
jgi:effector-binding domain-containing protein